MKTTIIFNDHYQLIRRFGKGRHTYMLQTAIELESACNCATGLLNNYKHNYYFKNSTHSKAVRARPAMGNFCRSYYGKASTILSGPTLLHYGIVQQLLIEGGYNPTLFYSWGLLNQDCFCLLVIDVCLIGN